MTSDGGPWGSRTPEPERPAQPARARARLQTAWPIVLLLVGLGGLVLALTKAFPEALQTGQDWSNVVYYAGFAVLVAAGAWRMRSIGPTQILRHAALWAAIVAVLALGFAYRDEISAVPQRLSVAFNTGRPVVVGAHELAISEDERGGFEVVGKVDGQPVRFMIDTGATDTVLTPQDARRLGVDLSKLRFDEQAETANGKGFGAPYVARALEIGPIRLANFKMTINQAPMSRSLLGLSFLNRLDSFEIRGRKLYLKWGG
ncbi:MAG TPA: TIGR02281 family clan AA aspartic protease [Caulobacteraceae bacterium]